MQVVADDSKGLLNNLDRLIVKSLCNLVTQVLYLLCQQTPWRSEHYPPDDICAAPLSSHSMRHLLKKQCTQAFCDI